MRENIFDEQKCRICGCTWNNACEGGCYWVEDDLCSACAKKMMLEMMLELKEIDEGLEFEMLEYGDKVELRNGDICIYVRRELEGDSIISQELVLMNTFTGEERCINEYKDNLEHDRNPSLDIKRFVN